MKKAKIDRRLISRFILRALIMASIGIMCAAAVPQAAMAQHRVVSIRMFYNELSPYGKWIAYPQYGRVWIPAVAPGFSPYATDGHWEDTEYGLAWVSDYPWGWAPFHYGRWLLDPALGWVWVPGTEWAPAWVAWSQADDYYGWAPIPPGFSFSINIGMIPSDRWYFVRDRYIIDRHLDRYYINRSYNRRLMRDARVIHGFGHGRGGEGHGRGNGFMNEPQRKDMQYVSPDRGSSRRVGPGRQNLAAPDNPGDQPTIQQAPAPNYRGRGVEKHSMQEAPGRGEGNRGGGNSQPQKHQMPGNGGGGHGRRGR